MEMKSLLSKLEKRGFAAKYFETGAEAAEYICATVQGKSVGMGGSITLEQLCLYEKLVGNNTVFWHWREKGFLKNAAEAQVYISSANAISEDGEIVNIDGTGNRVSAMCYGHEKLIIVAGQNKIAKDLPAAIDRAKNVAAPLNAIRLKKNTPCALSAEHRCFDCESPDRICGVTSVLSRRPGGIGVIEVIIVGETLGY